MFVSIVKSRNAQREVDEREIDAYRRAIVEGNDRMHGYRFQLHPNGHKELGEGGGGERVAEFGCSDDGVGKRLSYASVQQFAHQEAAKAMARRTEWDFQTMLKHMPSCAKSGAFGCGGRDYSSDYGHVHQGHAVVFI
ncbi:hypothetical protein GUITHDRAFT_107069 [Guillardia theta CCMP2712]|uniref:Uncharacterized protein n=1 Tax=Guillardia theta (strain CCMP2712) TaxID=905079 RepID=L1JF42_GUITC|nr:hypothetical protein GUITHDRAFT_107069 [Guillardia theta CCMP2712]EKX47158.1 hypothetical protein GUITHDRAFT_107069 [Guillardia theta CCMP2712]|eukprot:XP_005834138.1 hypothetical protein GUITHDRAFT_107069 [Guillardia theta CCMP2712]